MKARFPLFAAAAALIAPTAVCADVRHSVDLSAGPLAASVVALSRATGASIRVADAGLWQHRVPAVRGQLTVGQALGRLLAGSGAHPVRLGGSSWQIAADQTPAPRAISPPRRRRDRRPDHRQRQQARHTAQRLPRHRFDPVGIIVRTGGPANSDSLVDRAASVTSTHLGAGRDKLFIRGVADSGLIGPTQATVGQYLGDLRLTYNAPDPDLRLYDIASVEVLEGPQGTLYGAGSPGGIIRIVRREPVLDRIEGAATLRRLHDRARRGRGGRVGDAQPAGRRRSGGAAASSAMPAATAAISITRPRAGRTSIASTPKAAGRCSASHRATAGRIDVGGTAQDIHGDDSQYADRDGPPLTRQSAIAPAL